MKTLASLRSSQDSLHCPYEGPRTRNGWQFYLAPDLRFGHQGGRVDWRLSDDETANLRDSNHRDNTGKVGRYHSQEYRHKLYESRLPHDRR